MTAITLGPLVLPGDRFALLAGLMLFLAMTGMLATRRPQPPCHRRRWPWSASTTPRWTSSASRADERLALGPVLMDPCPAGQDRIPASRALAR